MNIKINDTIIKNVSITDSGDLIGLGFVTELTLPELDNLFSPATSPEIRIVDAEGKTTDMYKNRNLIDLHVNYGETENQVKVALLVAPMNIPEVELLINQVNAQAEQIAEQANVIKAQANDIAEQANEIEILKTTLSATQEELTTAQTALTETQAANDMLMECVLEMSEVVYA